MRVRADGRDGEAVEWNPMKVPAEVIVRFGSQDFGSFPLRKVEPLGGTRDELHDFLEGRDPYGVRRA